MNKFYANWGGCETTTEWYRPNDYAIRRWRDSLTSDLTNWFLVGNVIEKHSPTFDLDVILIQPTEPPLEELSRTFTEMISKGFEQELLIDCCYMPQFYQDEWQPITKVRPDKEFIKHWNGEEYHSVYKADEVEQLSEQLWKFHFNKPHHNWQKGKDRGYDFTGIELSKF